MLSMKKKSPNKTMNKSLNKKSDEKKNQKTNQNKTIKSDQKATDLKIINVIEQKIFTRITNLFSNNFYGGIYNLKAKSSSNKSSQNKTDQKVFIIDWQMQQSINYKDQHQAITAIERYSQTSTNQKDTTKQTNPNQTILNQITLSIPEIWVGQYYVFIPIPKMITFMYLPLDEKLKHVDDIKKIIHQLIEYSENTKTKKHAQSLKHIPFNNYLLNEDTNEIKFWEFMSIDNLSVEEYARYLQVCFVIQLVCKNVLECNQFQVQLQFRTVIQRIDDFMSSEEKNKSCPVKYWRVLFSPYYIYERYLDVNLFQMFVNTVSQNEKMINQLISTLQRQVIKVY